jgi:hypothetical protein
MESREEKVTIENGKFINALVEHCDMLRPYYKRVMLALEDAKALAEKKGDIWLIGALKRVEDEFDKASLETDLYCGIVRSLKERVAEWKAEKK